MDIYHFENHLHENIQNQQQIYTRSAYLYYKLIFGGVLLIIQKQICMVKIAAFLAEYHTTPVISLYNNVSILTKSHFGVEHINPEIPRFSMQFDLTHWGRDKIADILQTTFSNALSWMKCMNPDKDFTEACCQRSN